MFTILGLAIIYIVSQIMIGTIKEINNSIYVYKNKAVDGKILVLSIEKDLNYISRCSRNIMLGGNYLENFTKIENKTNLIKENFKLLEKTLLDTKEQEKNIDILRYSKTTTLKFIDGVKEKIKLLKNSNNEQKNIVYKEYQKDLTPLAIQSRKYFSQIANIKDRDFDAISNMLDIKIEEEINFIIIASIFLAIFTIIFMNLIYTTINKQTQTQENLDSTNNLLDQYKDAIDYSTIVSKADLKGNITYINDKFCSVSQYTKEELIGKPHNIVRHPNMSKKAFKDMWATIKAKMIWHGIVENRKKDGSSYFVDTTIVPILDSENNIGEYISIRTDISEIFSLTEHVKVSQNEILNRMGMIAETRSKETGNHVKRVAKYSEIIAKELNLDEEEIELLYNASALHDIGKVGIPDAILNKPTKLTKDEFEIMKNHAQYGYNMLKGSKNKIVQTGAIIAHQHHERYDGTGYPNNLKGEEINLFARITSLADVFDALSEERPYKKAWTIDEISQLVKDERGKHFDPVIVDIFLNNLDKFIVIKNKLKD